MSDKPAGYTAQAKVLDGTATCVPGQAVLPELQKEVGYDSAVFDDWREQFCWEYVENGSVAYKAYLVARPSVKDTTARVEASKLLTSPNIVARIASIRKELRERYAVTADDLLEHHGRVLKIDRRRFFSENGSRIPIHELDHELASIVDLDATFCKNLGIVMLPVVASREKSKEAMARILGLDKSSSTVVHRFSDLSDDEMEQKARDLAHTIVNQSKEDQ